MESRIKIKLIDWQNPGFVRAFDAGLTAAFRDGLEADQAGLAERVETVRLTGDGGGQALVQSRPRQSPLGLRTTDCFNE